MMKTSLLSLCLTIVGVQAGAQITTIDSLKVVLQQVSNDSTKVNLLNQISTLYLDVDSKQAITYANQAKEIAEKDNNKVGLGYAYKAIGMVYYNQGKYPEALIQCEHALHVFEEVPFKLGIANMLSNIGAIYFNMGNDVKAIEYHFKSLKTSEELNDTLRIGTSMINIGAVYNNNPSQVDMALEYFEKSLALFEKIKYEDGVGFCCSNIGEVYFDKGQLEKALPYFERAVRVFDNTLDAIFSLTYLGRISAEKKDFAQAMRYHSRSITLAQRLGGDFDLTQALLGLADAEARQGKNLDAIKTLKRAEAMALSIKANKELKEAYAGLSKAHAALGDFANAFRYDTCLRTAQDILYKYDGVSKMQQMQFNFDMDKKEIEVKLKDATIRQQEILGYATGITGGLLLLILIGIINRYKYIKKTSKIIERERDRSVGLLLNILPEETAHELETLGYAKPRYYENVTVLFTDFKGFTNISRKLSPQDLIAELNEYFMAFDEIVMKHNLEKIKTIGDSYMCVGGIPTVNNTHAINAVDAALDMLEFIDTRNAALQRPERWELRVGIHSGPVITGVVGKRKYSYDIWGDTVNIASRMEASGQVGKINISSTTFDLLMNHTELKFEYRGKIEAKNVGAIDMYFVENKCL